MIGRPPRKRLPHSARLAIMLGTVGGEKTIKKRLDPKGLEPFFM